MSLEQGPRVQYSRSFHVGHADLLLAVVVPSLGSNHERDYRTASRAFLVRPFC
ncbi:MAG: hypothetical protein JWM61_2539 [Micrococcaceae bacterium]|nr:hypothetical protein [Micrococcaceae bacterium]